MNHSWRRIGPAILSVLTLGLRSPSTATRCTTSPTRRTLAGVDAGFFDHVRNAFEGFVARVGGQLHTYAHGRGLKVWFDGDTREHYEAQLIRVDGATRLEVGFHAEHAKAEQNDKVIGRLVAHEAIWRPELGDDAEVAEFLGRHGWRRISEVWPPPNPEITDEAIEVAARLADYVLALEPVRRRSA